MIRRMDERLWSALEDEKGVEYDFPDAVDHGILVGNLAAVS